MPDWIEPDWPAPSRVRALSTLRSGGLSRGPWASQNLGDRCGDDPATVRDNRQRLREAAGLPAEPAWLAQEHGTTVMKAGQVGARAPAADAAVTDRAATVCVVQTADCAPVLLCDRAGTRVGAVHAGWRGLAAGVVDAAVAGLGSDPRELMAWIGPCIGPAAFEVGVEVRDAFDSPATAACFSPGAAPGKWLADLPALVAAALRRAGVTRVHASGQCTVSAPQRYFSYRRDGRTGRMASLIWLA